MITLLEALNYEKGYKAETFYLAVSICDRYLVNLLINDERAPCLIMLSVVATLMAAKLEQPMQPNFNRMARLVKNKWDVTMTRQELIDLEKDVIDRLDFELQYTGPLLFLERFLRIYSLDQTVRDIESLAIASLAAGLLKKFVREQAFLSFKPSQMAAAALTIAINASESKSAKEMGLIPVCS